MNLISNCCLIGDYCENNHIQYFTPFVWNTFFPDDIKVLINEYKNIPQYAKGIPKKFDFDVCATESQSTKLFTEQKLGSA